MARNIPTSMAGILSELELNRPELVTMHDIESLVRDAGLDTPPRIVAARLREIGWLLPTSQRGVWEFAPAESAGAYSSADPLIPLKAFRLANPGIECALTFQSAAWAQGWADRVPSVIEVAFTKRLQVKVPDGISGSTFRSNFPLQDAKGVPVLGAEGIVIHMTERPSAVRSWQSATEWLPDVAYELDVDRLLGELKSRTASIYARTGYLLQGMRPDITDALALVFTPKTKIRFGSGKTAIRNDERWKVVDMLLPFDPRKMEALR